ncbi:MAG: hypothetical protein F6J90_05025 [Moorea sp. SIOASIH]|uniref:hypothetical protein n=1 Tax=Moorena sp. SIOASIH TaxID=2607817 RepID=UPI0013BD4CE0|nr:hypothetical protein [Moorena sp. SIOASIH]NEO35717.1 hypothetical protein [Moorena sp. SIOASIH]NEO90562.1 hypothetical protein [Moorena sp. SIO3G5]
MCSKYAGVQQHWFVVETQKPKESDLKQLQNKLAKATPHWQTKLQKLNVQEFACSSRCMGWSRSI